MGGWVDGYVCAAPPPQRRQLTICAMSTYLPPSANCQRFPTSPTTYAHQPPISARKRPCPLLLGSIEEESSEYDCGILDLGAETPSSAHSPTFDEQNAFVSQWAQAGVAAPRAPLRRQPSRASLARERERTLKREAVDRDCGIWCVQRHRLAIAYE